MVVSCSAYGCTQRHEPGITFHSFPKEKTRLKEWLLAMKRDKWKPGKRSVLCSRHFKSDCYNTSGWSSKKSLKIDAVPSEFDITEHLQKPSPSGPSPKKRNLAEAELDIITIAERTLLDGEGEYTSKEPTTDVFTPPPRKKRRIFIGDFQGDPSQFSHEELRLFYKLAKDELAKKTGHVKLLKQSGRRLQQKLKNVKSLVDDLANKHTVQPETTSSITVTLNSPILGTIEKALTECLSLP